MESVCDADRAMIVSGGGLYLKVATLAIQLSNAALRDILPFTGAWRHEADAVNAIAIVETAYFKAAVALRKAGGKTHIDKRVAIRGTLQRKFERAPLFN